MFTATSFWPTVSKIRQGRACAGCDQSQGHLWRSKFVSAR